MPKVSEVEQLCQYLAISDVYRWSDVFDKLVCTLVVAKHPIDSTFEVLKGELNQQYGLNISFEDLDRSTKRLAEQGLIETRENLRAAKATGKAVAQVSSLIQKSRNLEEQVKQEWFASMSGPKPVDQLLYWDALISFLKEVLKSFGSDSLGLLGAQNSIIELKPLQEELAAAATRYALQNEVEELKRQVSIFFETIRDHPSRQKFVAELAQGLFAWQSIHAPPEVSEKLAAKSKPITILVDTSFLVDLVGLADSEAIENANHVFDCVAKAPLDVKWRYLPTTENELRRVIAAAKHSLKNNWGIISGTMAAALTKGGSLQGVKAAYVAARAIKPISVDDFFLKYSNLRKILSRKNIEIYQSSNPPSLLEREEMASSFGKFLEEGKDRGFSNRRTEHQDRDQNTAAIEHDAELLAQAAKLRNNSGALLEARMLVLSNDRKLAKFDLKTARKVGRQGVVLLPYSMLQMARPFISSADYGEILVSCLLAPEFRGLVANGGTEEVKQKVISLMSAVEDLDVDDALELLADKAFVRHLDESEDAATAQEVIKVAAIQKNIALKAELEEVSKAFASSAEDVIDLQKRVTRSETALLATEQRVRDLAKTITDTSTQKDDLFIAKSATDTSLSDTVTELQQKLDNRSRLLRLSLAVLTLLLTFIALYFGVEHIPANYQLFSVVMIWVAAACTLISITCPKTRGKSFIVLAVPLLLKFLSKIAGFGGS